LYWWFLLNTLEAGDVVINVQEIGKRIVSLRKSRGWSTYKLAEVSGVDLGQLSKLEKGTKDNLTIETVNRISIALGYQASQLLSESEIEELSKPKTESDYLVDLGQTFKNLNIKNFSYLSEIIRVSVCGSVLAGTARVVETSATDDYVIIFRNNLPNISHLGGIYAVRVYGESLSGNEIHNGDALLVLPTTEIQVNSKIYICYFAGESVIKLVERTSEGKYLLKATNDHYQTIEPSELAIKGRVVWIQPSGRAA
jgi:transcriptional regulator with XRE-family HTH domain